MGSNLKIREASRYERKVPGRYAKDVCATRIESRTKCDRGLLLSSGFFFCVCPDFQSLKHFKERPGRGIEALPLQHRLRRAPRKCNISVFSPLKNPWRLGVFGIHGQCTGLVPLMALRLLRALSKRNGLFILVFVFRFLVDGPFSRLIVGWLGGMLTLERGDHPDSEQSDSRRFVSRCVARNIRQR